MPAPWHGPFPQSKSDDDKVERADKGVSAPRLTHKVEPEYTDEAREANLEGIVVLQTVVETDGRAHQLKVVRGLGMGLDEEAIKAVRQWRFEPGKKDGKPVAVEAAIEVAFRLP